MSLQCKKCGSRNTSTVKAKEMADRTGDSSFNTAASGMINPVLVIATLKAIIDMIGNVFNWLTEKEKNDASVVVCKDCGYWERI